MAYLSAHHRVPSQPERPEAHPSFVREARDNLHLVRQLYGRRSRPYRRLARQYRRVAQILGCRRQMERLLHPLRRGRPGCLTGRGGWRVHRRGTVPPPSLADWRS